MRQGADRAPLKDRKDDLYETPPEATLTLLRAEKLPLSIWEPCAGRGAIARILRGAGHTIITYDLVAYEGADPGIETGIDFLMERAAPAGCSCIVTNPPFKLSDAFIRHGLSLGCDVIVLLRLMAIEGANRSDLMDTFCRRVYAGIERLPKMQREGWEGKRQESETSPFAWFVFSPTPRQLGEAIELRRVSWRT